MPQCDLSTTVETTLRTLSQGGKRRSTQLKV